MKYDYNTFKELYDSYISYCYENSYGCSLEVNVGGVEAAVFHKLDLYSDGSGQYKTDIFTFDPRLWPKVKLLVEMLTETSAEKVLFKGKP